MPLALVSFSYASDLLKAGFVNGAGGESEDVGGGPHPTVGSLFLFFLFLYENGIFLP